MRDFSWRYFTLTGDIDAYLLYKAHERLTMKQADAEEESDEQEVVHESSRHAGIW
ncbi:hypothetical protein GCM10010885_17900 [Alicyclobacillus cellulosilyticus]|uniref:YqzL-like protein n=1 Tax=Alicyclobacillus cellulosilyticus TaxID=1003997 RepID=A0A917KCQ5_9BACL|nr:YqzL family protein [Alicyclobacillus cellulosilyticus]GGJ09244.1 hypothetical protein GCM10010885_17900 [Alicyclobacillus cellulosilyticus]